MCVTFGPAELSKTIVFASETNIQGERRHLLGYQNHPVSTSGANAMLLPIPGKFTPEDLIVTDGFPHILQDMALAVQPRRRGISFDTGLVKVVEVVVFEYGIYTMILANDARTIPTVLDQVLEEKRPPLNQALFDAYAEWYPDSMMLLCCFNNADAQSPAPILLSYKPNNPDVLFLPGLDSHSGQVPDLQADVLIDHTIIVSAAQMFGGHGVFYSDTIPEDVRAILPKRVRGTPILPDTMPNGDWLIPLATLRSRHADNLQRYTDSPYFNRHVPPYTS